MHGDRPGSYRRNVLGTARRTPASCSVAGSQGRVLQQHGLADTLPVHQLDQGLDGKRGISTGGRQHRQPLVAPQDNPPTVRNRASQSDCVQTRKGSHAVGVDDGSVVPHGDSVGSACVFSWRAQSDGLLREFLVLVLVGKADLENIPIFERGDGDHDAVGRGLPGERLRIALGE